MARVSMETPNALMVVFSNTVSAGFNALQGAVNGVFGLLIVLVVALTGIQWALSANREVLAAGFGKVLLIGAFAYLINDWQQLSETLYVGFLELGRRIPVEGRVSQPRRRAPAGLGDRPRPGRDPRAR